MIVARTEAGSRSSSKQQMPPAGRRPAACRIVSNEEEPAMPAMTRPQRGREGPSVGFPATFPTSRSTLEHPRHISEIQGLSAVHAGPASSFSPGRARCFHPAPATKKLDRKSRRSPSPHGGGTAQAVGEAGHPPLPSRELRHRPGHQSSSPPYPRASFFLFPSMEMNNPPSRFDTPLTDR